MSKRGQDTQGGEDRYGFSNGPGGGDTGDRPQQANAAQMARRKIAQMKKPGASARNSRANTPTANPFAAQQQSMPSFQLPQQGGGDGGAFNFSVSALSNPFQNTNGASATAPPSIGMSQQPQQQQNGGGGMFGNNSTSFGSTFASNTESNGFNFGGNTTNGNTTPLFGGGLGQSTQSKGQLNGATPSSTTPSFGFGQTNGNAGSTFQFGQSQAQTQTTQATSFGGFAQTPQTNGDKTAAPAANSFSGFGQSTQQQDNPATPAFSFGQNTQQPAEKPATPSLGMFGQSAKLANGGKAPMFGAAPQAELTPKPNTGSLFTFNPSNQGIGNKSTPEPTAKPGEAPEAPISNPFGAQPSTGTNLFGSTPPPRELSATPKPGESIFSTQNKPRLGGNLFTSDMAEGKKPDAPALIFGQPAQPKPQAAPDADQTPKANHLFGGFGQSRTNAVQDTPKPSSNLFSTSSFGQTPAQPAHAPPKNIFGQSVQDTSMTTPGSTPQKSSLLTPTTNQQATSSQSTASETPAPGRSLFDRITRDDDPPAPTQREAEKSSQPPMSFDGTAAPATARKALFGSPAASQSNSMFNKATTKTTSLDAQRPTSQSSTASQPSRPASTQRITSTLADVIPDNEADTLKVLNEGLMYHLAGQDPRTDWTTIMEYYLQQAAKVRHKPALKFATALAPAQSTDRSVAAPSSRNSEYAAQAKKPALSSLHQLAETSNNVSGSSTAATPRAPSLFQRTSTADSQQTPKPSFLQPPSTAPVNRRRSAEDEGERPPATEKRAKPSDSIEYPKLPGNASDVSKLFYNALENKTLENKTPDASQKQFENITNQTGHIAPTSERNTSSAGGFKPSTSGFTPSTAGFKPSGLGFTPSAPSGGSNNFLAAFGKKASEQEEKDRQKREDDEYDSEEETKEQWLEKDRKRQEEKKAKALEDAKSSSGFVFKATPATPKPAEKETPQNSTNGGQDKETLAESGQDKSLFDRISKPTPSTSGTSSLFSSSQTQAAKTLTSNIFGSTGGPGKFSTGSSLFGHLSKPAESAEKGENVEKETQGTGDKSWNPNTPIKFGADASAEKASTTPAAPPPSFGNLFGPKSQPSSSSNGGLLNVPGAKPTMGFQFAAQPASASGSRATTPGVTTDGEGTGASTAGEGDNEPSDDPPANEAQVEDMTGLSAEETKNETVLLSIAMSKASKWDEKKTDEGGMAHGWVDKGKGPLYLLKNNDSGKVRILLKVPPYGAAKMNFPPLKGGGYEVQGKTGKQITGTFYDHLAEKPGLGKWLVAVGKKEDAEEISRILREGMPE